MERMLGEGLVMFFAAVGLTVLAWVQVLLTGRHSPLPQWYVAAIFLLLTFGFVWVLLGIVIQGPGGQD